MRPTPSSEQARPLRARPLTPRRPGRRPRPRTLLAALLATLTALCLAGVTGSSANAVAPTRTALAWGANGYGQLGDGTRADSTTPVRVALPAGTRVTAVAANAFHSLALTSNGGVLAWGVNADGQLGDGTTTNRDTPVRVKLPRGARATAVAAGGFHSLALASDGRVFAWGSNGDGQLGTGSARDSRTPVEVQLPHGVRATAVSAGHRHSLALLSDGCLLAWGDNDGGQLGDGTETNRPTPVRVAVPHGVKVIAVAAGYAHTLALTSGGSSVLAWGLNGLGELGDGTTTHRLTPIPVALPVGTRVAAIATEDLHSLALTSRGRVLAWGPNFSGQLGDGTTIPFSTRPVEARIPATTCVTAIATGTNHSLALTSDGRVLAWGGNSEGQLGNGTTTNSNTPVDVALPRGARGSAIAGGGYFSLALAGRASHP